MDRHAAQARCTNNLSGDFCARQRVVDSISAVPLQSLNPTATSRLEWRPVVRSPEQLRLHPALKELGWIGGMDEFTAAARLKDQSVPEPILITTNGTILAGYGRWQSAVFDGRHEINCIEYPLVDDEALQFIIRHHRSRCGWNAFVRIRLALTLESYYQQKAIENMRVGGKWKGLTNLSNADRIDVRQQMAHDAGTGTSNVDKVKAILHSAHPNIIAALQNDLLKIHRAWKWCKLPRLQQKAEFARYEEDLTQRKILHGLLPKPTSVSLDPAQVIDALQRLEARQPGSIDIRTSRSKRTVVILAQGLLQRPDAQKELERHA